MKDFENDLIYYPNPDPIEEPRFILNSVEELEKSTKYSVVCNGTERVVYHTDSFDYVIVVDDEAYDLEISIHTPFEKLAIRPTSFGIVPSVTGETVQIHLDEPKKFTVETDGGLHDALFVFCSRRIEKPENTTICFEKGKVYNVGVLTLKPNDTVYIEEGAVVSGCIYADHCDNISIIGNGIVNGACWHLPDSNAHRFFIYIKWCNNVLLKGFTAVDGPSWHVVPAACDHVVIDDMNIMSRIVTGDGIDITSSQDVDCLLYTSRNDSKEPLLAGKVGIFFGPWWCGYTVGDATMAGEADWRAYFTPLAEDGDYYTHMAEPTSVYVVASKSCKNPEAAFKIISYLVANEQRWVAEGITTTEMNAPDLYPLWNVYDNADEIEVSTETLEKYLAGEITMDDVDFSRHKLLKNDMEAVTELKKEPYDDFSLDKWNLDSDLVHTNLPRLVSLLVGGYPLVNDKYIPVYNAYNGQTETMEAKWANLKKMEEETFAKIITGKADISEFDTFVKNWKSQGGDQILKEINDELSK